MGEAKRKRERRAAGIPYLDVATGKTETARAAGDLMGVLSDVRRMAEAGARGDYTIPARVPCDGCTACCHYARVDVHPHQETPESLAVLDLVEDAEGLSLRKREDGACVHLGPAGCTVYAHRPHSCRAYDCRLYALTGMLDSYDGGRHQPRWIFDLPTRLSQATAAAMQMLGWSHALQLRKRGEPCTAHAVLAAVLADKRLVAGIDAFGELLAASPEMQTRMLGFDPRAVPMEQRIAAMREMAGMISGQETPE